MSILRSRALPMVLTYVLLLIVMLDVTIDRFEAILMLVLGGVLAGGVPATATAATTADSSTARKNVLFITITLLAVGLGTYYLLAGVLFVSTGYAVSLPFLALTFLAPVLLLPLLLSTFAVSSDGVSDEASVHIIDVTLLMTLCGVGVAGCLTSLVTDTVVVTTGLWYVVVCAAAVVTTLLSGVVERRMGVALFLVGIVCVAKLVVLM